MSTRVTRKDRKQAYLDIKKLAQKYMNAPSDIAIEKTLKEIVANDSVPDDNKIKSLLLECMELKDNYQNLKNRMKGIGLEPNFWSEKDYVKVDNGTRFTRIVQPNWQKAEVILSEFSKGLVLLSSKEELEALKKSAETELEDLD